MCQLSRPPPQAKGDNSGSQLAWPHTHSGRVWPGSSMTSQSLNGICSQAFATPERSFSPPFHADHSDCGNSSLGVATPSICSLRPRRSTCSSSKSAADFQSNLGRASRDPTGNGGYNGPASVLYEPPETSRNPDAAGLDFLHRALASSSMHAHAANSSALANKDDCVPFSNQCTRGSTAASGLATPRQLTLHGFSFESSMGPAAAWAIAEATPEEEAAVEHEAQCLLRPCVSPVLPRVESEAATRHLDSRHKGHRASGYANSPSNTSLAKRVLFNSPSSDLVTMVSAGCGEDRSQGDASIGPFIPAVAAGSAAGAWDGVLPCEATRQLQQRPRACILGYASTAPIDAAASAAAAACSFAHGFTLATAPPAAQLPPPVAAPQPATVLLPTPATALAPPPPAEDERSGLLVAPVAAALAGAMGPVDMNRAGAVGPQGRRGGRGAGKPAPSARLALGLIPHVAAFDIAAIKQAAAARSSGSGRGHDAAKAERGSNRQSQSRAWQPGFSVAKAAQVRMAEAIVEVLQVESLRGSDAPRSHAARSDRHSVASSVGEGRDGSFFFSKSLAGGFTSLLELIAAEEAEAEAAGGGAEGSAVGAEAQAAAPLEEEACGRDETSLWSRARGSMRRCRRSFVGCFIPVDAVEGEEDEEQE